jgi:hypothetical protein
VLPNPAKTEWNLRQSQDSRVLCEEDLLENPANIGYVVLDVEDEWQLLSAGDPDKMVSIPLEDALDLLPELELLDFLRPGMVAVAGKGPVTWFVESYDPADLEPVEHAVWGLGWNLPFSPEFECSVSPDLAEIFGDDPAKVRKVYQITREDPEVWSFFGQDAEDDEEHYPLLLRDVVALYPDVAEALREHAATTVDLIWDDETGTWMDADVYARIHQA